VTYFTGIVGGEARVQIGSRTDVMTFGVGLADENVDVVEHGSFDARIWLACQAVDSPLCGFERKPAYAPSEAPAWQPSLSLRGERRLEATGVEPVSSWR